MARNPAYIGWKIWAGEVINKSVYPPIIDEDTFWTVQGRFNGEESRPKREFEPLPLAGLLYCANHDTLQRMTYINKTPSHHSIYRCYDPDFRDICASITAHHLDHPISEAVISQLTLPDVSKDVLNQLTDEYEAAKDQAASYRRERKRLETEVENLRGNLVAGVMSVKELEWLA